MPRSAPAARSSTRRRPLPALAVARAGLDPAPPHRARKGPISVVVIAHEPTLRRETVRLAATPGFEVRGTAAVADAGVRLYDAQRPDVVVVDLGLRAPSGLDVIARLVEADPAAAVLAYAGVDVDGALVDAAAACGARGFALHDGGSEELAAGIGAVARGAVYLDPGVTAVLAARPARKVLSVREQEILEMLAAGLTGREAAAALSLSSETVRTHIRNAMRKLDVSTRVHAVTLALSLGEIPAPGRTL